MKKILLSALLSSMIVSSSAMAGTLLVGTDAGLAPFEFKDPKTNEIVGFDIDLINAIAKAVGDEAKIQNMQFAGLIPAFKVTWLMSGLQPSPLRRNGKNKCFSLIHTTMSV